MGTGQNNTNKATLIPSVVVFSATKIENIKDAIRKTGGIVSDTAKAIGVGRNTLYVWFREYPELKEAVADARDSFVDLAESKLMKAVREEKPYAICFALKCLGKSRGYVERQEITGKNGQPLNAGYTNADDLSNDQLADIVNGKDAANQ